MLLSRETDGLSIREAQEIAEFRYNDFCETLFDDVSNLLNWNSDDKWEVDGIAVMKDNDAIIIKDLQDEGSARLIEYTELLYYVLRLPNIHLVLASLDESRMLHMAKRTMIVFNIDGVKSERYLPNDAYKHIHKKFIGMEEIVIPFKTSLYAANFIMLALEDGDFKGIAARDIITIVHICRLSNYLGIMIDI